MLADAGCIAYIRTYTTSYSVFESEILFSKLNLVIKLAAAISSEFSEPPIDS
jgi:hypothetical protein